MKIGILTFHCAPNYGAILQTYGLQEKIKSLGHEAYILDYRPKFLAARKIFNFQKQLAKKNLVKEMIRRIAYAPIRFKRFYQFLKFQKKYLNCISFNQYKQLDAIIVGSDQIWNSEINFNDFDNKYFLNFIIPENIIKIAYAASAGNIETFKNRIKSYQLKYIKDFNYISVRETSLAMTLKDLLNLKNNPPVVLDPVILCGKNIFEKFLDPKFAPKEKYILVFSLGYSPNVSFMASEYAKTKNLRVINVSSVTESIGHRMIESASISQFLSLIYFANTVFTTSFHGTAFSIIFNKPFVFFANNPNHGERCSNLLSLLGIKEKIKYISENSINLENSFNIDYQKVNSNIDMLREKSTQFLKNALKNQSYNETSDISDNTSL